MVKEQFLKFGFDKLIWRFFLIEAFLLSMFAGKILSILPLTVMAFLASVMLPEKKNINTDEKLPLILRAVNACLVIYAALRMVACIFDNDDYKLTSIVDNITLQKPLIIALTALVIIVLSLANLRFLKEFECFCKIPVKESFTVSCTDKKAVPVIVLCSFLIITVLSKSSPLYPLNNWGDANCYFTVGRALLKGKILYRDIFDHKGPLLYFLHSAASLISDNSFLGVWILEIICASLFGIISLKTVRLFVSCKYDTAAIVIGEALIYAENCLGHGDSAEELCLPAIAYILYLSCKFVLDKKIKAKEYCLLGVAVFFAFWIKYTLVSILAGAFVVLTVYAVRKGKAGQLFKGMGLAIGMFCVLTIPILIYFAANDSMKDLINVYFLENVSGYNRSNRNLFFGFLKYCLNAFRAFVKNPLLLYVVLLTMTKAFRRGKEQLWLFVTLFFFASLPIFGVSAYFYYAFPLNVFMPVALIVLLPAVEKAAGLMKKNRAALCVFAVAVAAFAIVSSSNTYLLKEKLKDQPQYILSNIINQDSDRSLLDLSHLDNGFYLRTGQIPQQRYFMENNLIIEEAKEEWNDVFEKGSVKYIITREDTTPSALYEQVESAHYHFEGVERYFYLYRRK